MPYTSETKYEDRHASASEADYEANPPKRFAASSQVRVI